MFTLIAVLLGIALAAAVAVATIYYGGSAFSSGGVQADATSLVDSGSQISGAATLYANQNAGALPATVVALVPAYLSTTPNLPSSLSAASWSIGTATVNTAGTALTVDLAGASTPGPYNVAEVAGPLSASLCAKVNEAAIGATGSATSDGNLQFGCDTANSYYYTISKN
jgi:hypothetical protein